MNKCYKVLAIGNSFSEDATRYLYDIAKSEGVSMKVINLFIGGCSLARHYKNINNDGREYELQLNGHKSGIGISIREALQSDEWDYVTFQQASHYSFDYETYQPYLNALSDYVKFHAPKAKQVIHQTWAYEQGSAKLENAGYCNQSDMFKDVEKSYNKAFADINATAIIPSGEAFQNLLKNGIEKVHRDSFHASLGVGRLTLALTWYGVLTGNSPLNAVFCNTDEPVSEAELETAKKSSHDAINKYDHRRLI